jgi:hypothetical protein
VDIFGLEEVVQVEDFREDISLMELDFVGAMALMVEEGIIMVETISMEAGDMEQVRYINGIMFFVRI